MPAWIDVLALSVAALLALGVVLRDRGWRRRRARAWPDQLSVLREPYPASPGLPILLLVGGLGILAWAALSMGRWAVAPATLLVSLSLFLQTHRRWDERSAYCAMTLMTLFICGLCCLLGWALLDVQGWASPEQWGLGLVGIAAMTFMWHWLSQFWRQQLHQGEAWTTAGRLVVPAQRFGFVSAVAGLAMAARLALWPEWPVTASPEISQAGTWIAVIGVTAMVLALINRARVARCPLLASLAAIGIVLAGVFGWQWF